MGVEDPAPCRGRGVEGSVPAATALWQLCINQRSDPGLKGRCCAECPRHDWPVSTASGGAEVNLTMPMANGSSLLEASPTVLVPELESRPTTLSPTSTPGSTSLQPAVEDSKGTTAALPGTGAPNC